MEFAESRFIVRAFPTFLFCSGYMKNLQNTLTFSKFKHIFSWHITIDFYFPGGEIKSYELCKACKSRFKVELFLARRFLPNYRKQISAEKRLVSVLLILLAVLFRPLSTRRCSTEV